MLLWLLALVWRCLVTMNSSYIITLSQMWSLRQHCHNLQGAVCTTCRSSSVSSSDFTHIKRRGLIFADSYKTNRQQRQWPDTSTTASEPSPHIQLSSSSNQDCGHNLPEFITFASSGNSLCPRIAELSQDAKTFGRKSNKAGQRMWPKGLRRMWEMKHCSSVTVNGFIN